MILSPHNLDGVFSIFFEPKNDFRGEFTRVFCSEKFASNGLNTNWPQNNLSKTHLKGTIRGLHFQEAPAEEVKLVTCLSGEIFDVILDVRKGSKSFGKYLTTTLGEKHNKALYIPAGHAHGFQTLSDDVTLLYWHSTNYSPNLESGVNPTDGELRILWPLEPTRISQKDKKLPNLREI